ncbi:CatB-related O-acetyltransferase [Streptomyces sp. NPDC005890]|uniref:CatB-related O-acetyltransferase n=1 Tax=Streptomyces sp. NPDC005890 TaxID=3154568 RepID=UPI0033C21571
MSTIPDPTVLHPLAGPQRVVLLKPLVTDPRIEIGEFTYYDDPDGAEEFERRNVLYAYGPERLVIGRYCALATGTRFLMAGAEHPMLGVSTFPFTMFGGAWAERTLDVVTSMPSRGDTVVGNDVWFGHGVTVMPGVTIGDGAVIATRTPSTSPGRGRPPRPSRYAPCGRPGREPSVRGRPARAEGCIFRGVRSVHGRPPPPTAMDSHRWAGPAPGDDPARVRRAGSVQQRQARRA